MISDSLKIKKKSKLSIEEILKKMKVFKEECFKVKYILRDIYFNKHIVRIDIEVISQL